MQKEFQDLVGGVYLLGIHHRVHSIRGRETSKMLNSPSSLVLEKIYRPWTDRIPSGWISFEQGLLGQASQVSKA
ncbi:hypothetical protein LguiB_002347 [Lonicera macranthoides]